MGCDIHIWYERKENDKWVDVEVASEPNEYGVRLKPLDFRCYSTFAFLANVRNSYEANI